MDSIAIGIDLGTTNSCVSYYFKDRVNIVQNHEGGRITPSVVYYTEKNSIIVGEYAKGMSIARPQYGVFEIKRLIGRQLDDPNVQNNLKYFPFKLDPNSNDPMIVIDHPNKQLKKTPVEICTAILTKIKKDVESKLGCSVQKTVITVPAYFNVSQREATLAAGEKAGFTVLKLLNEPTAAALSYYFDNDCQGESHALIYDLGGGTFDVSILKRNGTDIDIICVNGDTHLGGQDFDNLIIDYVCDNLMERYKYNPRNDRREMRRLQNFCERAKKTLSVDGTEETIIILDGVVPNHSIVEIELTREKFESMADKYFKRTIDIVDGCLRSCNLSKNDIKEVILSGGSTRIPKIQQMLSEYFDGKKLNKFVNPDECVAEGAALQAAMLSTNNHQKISQIQITDVTPLSLGVDNFGGSMSFLIERNTKIPTSKTASFITVYNQQKSMSFEIFEGERKVAKQNHYLGKFEITNLTPAPPSQCAVLVTMFLDLNGILTVTATEEYKNNTKELTISYSRGHQSDSEVKNAIKDAEDHKDDDAKFEEFVKRKRYIMNYCIRAKYNFENKELISRYRDIYNLCLKMQAESKDMNVADDEKLTKMIGDIKQRCGPIIEEHNFEFMPSSS